MIYGEDPLRRRPGKSYHHATAKGTVSPLQPFDGLILEIGPRLEGHLPGFSAIQTHPPGR